MIELIHKRNWDAKTFDTGRTEIDLATQKDIPVYATKIQAGLHYAENGQYKDVDTKITIQAKYEFSHEVVKMRGVVRFGDTSANPKKHLFGVEDHNDNWLNVKLDVDNHNITEIIDNKIVFSGQADCNVNHYTLYNGVKTEYVLLNKNVNSYTVTFKHNDEIVPEQRGNNIVFTRDGKDIFTVKSPFAYDAAIVQDVTEPVTMTLGTTEGFNSATLTVDPTWLLASTTPIIDPDVTIDNDSGTFLDNMILDGSNADKNYGQDIELQVEDNRSFMMQVDLTLYSGITVVSSKFGLDFFTVPSAINIGWHRIFRTWVEGTKAAGAPEVGSPCWNYSDYTAVAWTTGGCKGDGTDRQATAEGTTDITVVSSDIALDMTNATTQNWLDNPSNNNGVLVERKSGSTSTVRVRSSQATTGNKPYFYMEYTSEEDGGFPFFFG